MVGIKTTMRNFFSQHKTPIIAAVTVAIALVVGGILLFSSDFDWLFPQAPNMGGAPHIVDDGEPQQEIIGTSIGGREIETFTYGDGATHLLFVGGIHGGYEWNSVALAYEFIDHLDANPNFVPDGFTVSVIPSANPDGLYDVVGSGGRFAITSVPPQEETVSGRFNANGVDLNRNFDCKWQPTGFWRGEQVSAGTEPFSEPEAHAIRDFVLEHRPEAVVFWHSKAGAVYASECEDGILPVTLDVMNVYARAADYRTEETFDAYPITGDAEGWLASIGIPAVSVELETHETVEFQRNLRGVEALLEYYNRK